MTARAWKEAARIEELERALEQPEDLMPVQVKNTEARKVKAVRHVRDSVRNRMNEHRRGLDASLVKSKGEIDVLGKLRAPKSILRNLKIRCTFAEVQQQAVYEFGTSRGEVMSTCVCCGNAGHEEHSGQWTVWSLGMVNDESQEFLGRSLCRTAQRYRFAVSHENVTQLCKDNEETVRYVLKDACEKVLLGCSNTRLENPASTKKLLDTIAEAEKDLKPCEGDTVPMEQKYSYGSGRRSRRELLGRLFMPSKVWLSAVLKRRQRKT